MAGDTSILALDRVGLLGETPAIPDRERFVTSNVDSDSERDVE